VTLIKSTLLICLRSTCLFPLLVGVTNCIEKIQWDFLWSGFGEEFKYHLVSWSKFCSPIFEGGLGIRNLMVFNRALFDKWLWRYGFEIGLVERSGGL
jgi:hypothetical protein